MSALQNKKKTHKTILPFVTEYRPSVPNCSESDSQKGNKDMQTPKDGKIRKEVHDIEQQVKPESATCCPPTGVSQHMNQDADTPKTTINCDTANSTSESDVEFVKTTKGCAPQEKQFPAFGARH